MTRVFAGSEGSLSADGVAMGAGDDRVSSGPVLPTGTLAFGRGDNTISIYLTSSTLTSWRINTSTSTITSGAGTQRWSGRLARYELFEPEVVDAPGGYSRVTANSWGHRPGTTFACWVVSWWLR
jgi:hypothetical protein